MRVQRFATQLRRILMEYERKGSIFDIPGFFLDRTAQALTLLDDVDQPNVRPQCDVA